MKLAGLRQDRAQLEALGIHGMLNPANRHLGWDEVDRGWQREAAARRELLAEAKQQSLTEHKKVGKPRSLPSGAGPLVRVLHPGPV